jgi:hypothetical protein
MLDPLRGKPYLRKLASEHGISSMTAQRGRTVVRKGHSEIIKAVESGKLPVYIAVEIVKQPKSEQLATLKTELFDKSIFRRVNAKAKETKGKPCKEAHYWEKFAARGEKLAGVKAFINEPSIFPEEAKVPKGDTIDEKYVRVSIEALRKNESLIPSLAKRGLDNLIYPHTQRILSYIANHQNNPRPEGKLDPRFFDWAMHAAKKMNGRQEFLRFVNQQKEIAKNVAMDQKESKKSKLSVFEAAFKELYHAQYKILSRFQIGELPQLEARWLEATRKIFQRRENNARHATERRAVLTAPK